jgi:serine protease AprX
MDQLTYAPTTDPRSAAFSDEDVTRTLMARRPCPVCGQPAAARLLARAHQVDLKILSLVDATTPAWEPSQGLCPACVQRALDAFAAAGNDLHQLIYRAELASDDPGLLVEPVALPLVMRLQANPRYTGRGVCIVMLDAGFYPHPDLLTPPERIRAVVDVSHDPVNEHADLDDPAAQHAHGLMTSVVAAGNGALSAGRYRGLASDAALVLVRVADAAGHITEAAIERALQWVLANREALGINLVNISLGGEREVSTWESSLDRLADAAVAQGLLVTVAAGNSPASPVLPPASAPDVLTVGGLNDFNDPDPARVALWHSTTGPTAAGHIKPEILAPSLWLAAPIPPGSPEAAQAEQLCSVVSLPDAEITAAAAALDLVPAAGEPPVEPVALRGALTNHMAAQGWVSANYKYVDGTSFAAPIVTSVAAQMREANPRLDGPALKRLLIETAETLPGIPQTQQGGGVVRPARAVAAALRAPGGPVPSDLPISPDVQDHGILFAYYDPTARSVRLTADFNGWLPGPAFEQIAPGVWCYTARGVPPGRYRYKFLVDGDHWIDDPENSHKEPDGYGGVSTVVTVF